MAQYTGRKGPNDERERQNGHEQTASGDRQAGLPIRL